MPPASKAAAAAGAKKGSSSIVTLRVSQSVALPPARLGFSALVKADEFEEGKPRLSANFHYSPEGIAALAEVLSEKVLTGDRIEELAKMVEENGGTGFPAALTAEEWLERMLREPRESRNPDIPQLPYLKLSIPQNYVRTNRDTGAKETKKRTISAWDPNNKKLKLAALRLGAGSVIEPIVYPNLFFVAANKATRAPALVAPSLRLIGIRVLELKQFSGGGNSAPGASDDETIAKVLGKDFHYSDLSAFVGEDDEDEGGAPAAGAGGEDVEDTPMF